MERVTDVTPGIRELGRKLYNVERVRKT